MIAILFGVSGSGKTTLGLLVAERLGWQFVDADDLHPESNREKMRRGIPLDDHDRAPWLDRLQRLVRDRPAEEHLVVAFSGLKRKYRDYVRDNRKNVLYVYLKATFDEVSSRLEHRQHAYMPNSLLASQFETLEEPSSGSEAVIVSVHGEPSATAKAIASEICSAQNKR